MAKKSEEAAIETPEAQAVQIDPVSKMREIIALSAIVEVNKDEKAVHYRGGADLIEFLRMGWRG